MAGKYVILTEQNFKNEVVESSKPVLVDFWADWCGPCRVIAPALEELAEAYDGQVTIGKLNVDEQPNVAAQFGIRSIPTLLFFQNGEVVDQVVGAVPKGAIESKLKNGVGTCVWYERPTIRAIRLNRVRLFVPIQSACPSSN